MSSALAPPIPWQQPNATEAFAAEQLAGADGYVAFPWATWIDRVRRDLSAGADPPGGDPVEGSGLIRATVCQHIWALEHLDLFRAAGITDLFWSHASTEHQQLNGLRIHPFPLYPVRCASHPAAHGCQPLSQRPLLYSFQGAYAPGLYLTPVRDWILNLPQRPDAPVERRPEWHYEQAVYREQVLRQPVDPQRAAQLAAEAEAYAHTMQNSVFALCPSGSGPNSIRLWEALGFGAIPVILSHTLWLPGDPQLWQQAALFLPETEAAVAALPARLEALAADHKRLQAMQAAGQQLWRRYGFPGFVPDLREFLADPWAVLTSRARRQLPSNPLVLVAASPAQLPLQLRRSLLNEPPGRSVLIRIEDQAPAELLQVRWQAALRIGKQLLAGRQWRVVSLSPWLEQGPTAGCVGSQQPT